MDRADYTVTLTDDDIESVSDVARVEFSGDTVAFYTNEINDGHDYLPVVAYAGGEWALISRDDPEEGDDYVKIG